MNYFIEEMKASDWPQIAAIYWEGIQTKIATFQAELPTWEQWDKCHSSSCRLIASNGETVVGWAALSPVSERCVYAGVANFSVYVGGQFKQQGVRQALMLELIKRSEEAGFWTMESRIIKENSTCQALHAECGFRLIGVREKLGKMDTGKWHDVVLMERRSQVAGVD